MKVRRDLHVTDSEVASDQPDPHITPGKVQEFKKGNINFDFLQPDGLSETSEADIRQSERRNDGREGKRGLFNRGRKRKPMGTFNLVIWAIVFLGCAGIMIASIWIQAPLFKLLLLPFLGLGMLGSLIMLALLKARPG